MSCLNLSLTNINTCNAQIYGKYQQIVFIKKEDLKNYSIKNNTPNYSIDFSLLINRSGLRFQLNENSSVITAIFSKNEKNGEPRYTHKVSFGLFGNSEYVKSILKEFDNSQDYFAVLLNKNKVIEVYGFHNGFKTDPYDYENDSVINLVSTFDEFEMPYNFVSDNPDNDVDLFNNDFRYNYFISKWVLNGTERNITLPISTANMIGLSVDWGDGVINSNNTHTYAESGYKTIAIKGLIKGFRFNNTGDVLKLIEISNWGDFVFTIDSVFSGCKNLDLSNTIGTPLIDTLSLINTFSDCVKLTTIKNINNWNFSNVESINNMFNDCNNFNQDLNLNTYSVKSMTGVFRRCYKLNKNIRLDLSSAESLGYLFEDAFLFNQDISNWDISNVTDFANIMKGKVIYDYLDNIYSEWSMINFKTNLAAGFGSIKYSQAGQRGKDKLLSLGWSITDGGLT